MPTVHVDEEVHEYCYRQKTKDETYNEFLRSSLGLGDEIEAES